MAIKLRPNSHACYSEVVHNLFNSPCGQQSVGDKRKVRSFDVQHRDPLLVSSH